MRVLFFGTYDAETLTRVRTLQEGFAALGDDVTECNVPLGLDTAWRVRILQRPWLLPVLGYRLCSAWVRLLADARRTGPVDAVVVGYMGHFDVHLARLRWRRQPIALDHLVSAADTALDRRSGSALLQRTLRSVDRAALRAAEVACIDTEEDLEILPPEFLRKAVLVPVGAPSSWFHEPPEAAPEGPLRVVFYGSYTPLHGATVIGEAIALLAGEGSLDRLHDGGARPGLRARAGRRGGLRRRDLGRLDRAGRAAARRRRARRLPRDLRHDPEGPARRADEGLRRSRRRVRRRHLGHGTAATCPGEAGVFVRPGDPAALAEALRALAADPGRTRDLRRAAYRHAQEAFRPEASVRDLRQRLAELTQA